jgi:glycerol dehydrogenase-like iron-containing ADH family enzyme
MKTKFKSGEGVLSDLLGSIGSYMLVTMEEPWEILKNDINNIPEKILFNKNMEIKNLERIFKNEKKDYNYIVGFGGGTSCDTAKYLSWKWDIPLIIAPSIISVDAWLCRSIAVRIDHNVNYIGNIKSEFIIVDYSIIKSAPKYLNWAGVGDIISITTALGDWIIARDVFNAKLDVNIFNKAIEIVNTLIRKAKDIKKVSNRGIDALVQGQIEEVNLCDEWGDSRPEEGAEHYLAYCLENYTHKNYLHGNLIALNTLVVLKLQKDNAVFDPEHILRFFDQIGIHYNPTKQFIKRRQYKYILENIKEFTEKQAFRTGLWSLDKVFESNGEYSVKGIIDWIYSFE